jgi:hypothetical protein
MVKRVDWQLICESGMSFSRVAAWVLGVMGAAKLFDKNTTETAADARRRSVVGSQGSEQGCLAPTAVDSCRHKHPNALMTWSNASCCLVLHG